jgi:hypothetical protein
MVISRKKIFFSLFVFSLLLLQTIVFSQEKPKKNPNGVTVINGKVTDAATGDGVPFTTVAILGTQYGTTTDFDGFYKLALPANIKADSIVFTNVSYATRSKKIQKGYSQTINVQLSEATQQLEEFVITPKGWVNPAWEILDNVMANKDRNDLRNLDGYQYEAFNRVELDVDNITEKFKKKKVAREILSLFDSAKKMAGEDGRPIIPIFVSETLSDYYYRKSPSRTREEIKKQKITGIGIEDGSAVSQLVGSTFFQYNFYQNWLNLGGKDFVSPIADSWKVFYEYTLVSKKAYVDGVKCYQISFEPKRPQDLAFTGTIWITDSTQNYALKRIDAKITSNANLNFIEGIKVQQELTQPEPTKPWLPTKTRVTVDVGDINDNWAGMLLKFYSSNKKFILNQPKDLGFYEEYLKIAEDALEPDPEYWAKNRHDSLTLEEKNVYQMIDTIKKLPTVRTYIEVIDLIINGYKRFGAIELGNYLYTVAWNNVEGVRPRIGFRTNRFFSNKWTLYGFGAYGTADNRFKYEIGVDYLISKKPWTQVGAYRIDDLNQVALLNESYNNTTNNIFRAFVRWRDVASRRPFYHKQTRFYIQTDLFKGFTQKVTFSHQSFHPLFDFQYYNPAKSNEVFTNLRTSEVTLETRISFKERMLDRGNRRSKVGKSFTPVFLFKYTYGLPNVIGSQLEYHKLSLNISQTLRLAALGRADYSVTLGYVPSKVPYLLLENHMGNNSPFYNGPAFNVMNYFEFTSDKFVDVRYEQHIEGLLTNSIPLLRKLKWRNFFGFNVLWGSVRQENRDIIPVGVPSFNPLNPEVPYIEAYYGIENIFKFVRVDFIHRVTYRHNPNAQNFGIKLSAALSL